MAYNDPVQSSYNKTIEQPQDRNSSISSSISSDSASQNNSSHNSSESSISESLGKPPPEPYRPQGKIEAANAKLRNIPDILEKNSKITFSETISQKSITEEDLEESEEEEPSENNQSRSESSQSTVIETKTALPISANTTQNTHLDTTRESETKLDSSLSVSNVSVSKASDTKLDTSSKTLSRNTSKSSESDHTIVAFSNKSKSSSKNSNKNFNMSYENDFIEEELSQERPKSVKFSNATPTPHTRSNTSLSNVSVASINSRMTRSEKLRLEKIQKDKEEAERLNRRIRPSSAQTTSSSRAGKLWDGEAPESANKLPNYRRPKSSAPSANARGRALASTSGPINSYDVDMKQHMRDLKEQYPHVKSAYAMPKEQKAQLIKREKIKAKRLKEKEELEAQNKKEDEEAAHQVWISWYETSIYEAKQKRVERMNVKISEKQKLQEDHEERKRYLKEQGVLLTQKAWKKSKDKEIKRNKKIAEEKSLRETAEKQAAFEASLKQSDKNFKKWLRNVQIRERREKENDLIMRKARARMLKEEARNQRALNSIRAAHEEAMTFRNFVF